MGGSVRIASAKPSFIGEMSFGYGNSINNQAEGGCGMGMSGGLPGYAEEAGWTPRPDPHWKKRALRWSWLPRKPIEYRSELEQLCVRNPGGVCRPCAHLKGMQIVWKGCAWCCTDKCTKQRALALATKIRRACFNPQGPPPHYDCEPTVPYLPKYAWYFPGTTPKDEWAVEVTVTCWAPQKSPFVQCICRKAGPGAEVSGEEFIECLRELGIGTCVGPGDGGSDGGEGNGGHQEASCAELVEKRNRHALPCSEICDCASICNSWIPDKLIMACYLWCIEHDPSDIPPLNPWCNTIPPDIGLPPDL